MVFHPILFSSQNGCWRFQETTYKGVPVLAANIYRWKLLIPHITNRVNGSLPWLGFWTNPSLIQPSSSVALSRLGYREEESWFEQYLFLSSNWQDDTFGLQTESRRDSTSVCFSLLKLSRQEEEEMVLLEERQKADSIVLHIVPRIGGLFILPVSNPNNNKSQWVIKVLKKDYCSTKFFRLDAQSGNKLDFWYSSHLVGCWSQSSKSKSVFLIFYFRV